MLQWIWGYIYEQTRPWRTTKTRSNSKRNRFLHKKVLPKKKWCKPIYIIMKSRKDRISFHGLSIWLLGFYLKTAAITAAVYVSAYSNTYFDSPNPWHSQYPPSATRLSHKIQKANNYIFYASFLWNFQTVKNTPLQSDCFLIRHRIHRHQICNNSHIWHMPS